MLKRQTKLAILVLVLLVIFLALGGYRYAQYKVVFLKTEVLDTESIPEIPSIEPIEQIPLILEGVLPDKVDMDVPFVSQAPYGEWGDPRQQDACEETSILMAAYWVADEKLDKATAKKAILKMAAYQEEKFGFSTDTSAADTAQLLKDYFDYDQGELVYDIDINDIRTQLAAGNIVVVTVNGRKLNNPNFTGGGPDRHALVIKGYDDNKEQFITNDPGTRNGANFKYSYKTMTAALRDYVSGYHQPITEERTAMIVIHPTPAPLNLEGNFNQTKMQITSKSFKSGEEIPSTFTCDGDSVLPELKISDVPAGSKSLAIIVDDPDAPSGDFVHWLAWNISPQTEKIASDSLPSGIIEGLTGRNEPGYIGLCPPVGKAHRYYFKLYALDQELSLDAQHNKSDLLAAMAGHILAETSLIGTYQREQ